MRLQAATLELPGIRMAQVQAVAVQAADGRPQVRFEAAHVTVPGLGWRDVGISLDGVPQRADGGAWKFVGHVTARRAPGGALADASVTVLLDRDDGTLTIGLAQGKTTLDAQLPIDQATHVQVRLAALPLTWLRGMLAAAWPDGRLNGGTASGDVALDLSHDGSRVSGRITVADLGLDSKAGTIAAQKLGADGTFRIDTAPAPAGVMFDGLLRGGQVLLGPLYARLPERAVGLHVAGSLGAAGIKLDSIDFDDADALRLSGSLAMDRQGALHRLVLTRFSATLPAAYDRYGTGLVQALTGFASLRTAGRFDGTLAWRDRALEAMNFTAHGVALEGPEGRLAVAGLDGGIDWRAGASRPATKLRWDSLSMYRIAFGPASLGLRDADGTLQLQAPVDVGLFGGALHIARFGWRPEAGAMGGVAAALAVTDVDLGRLCKALGWPAFSGTLGGAVPGLTYRGGTLAFDGGLSVSVFDGSASVTDLALRNPFGKSPRLAANVDLSNLDLAQLTGVFGFGQITGRLDGGIHGLRLEDWKPVAFTAALTANDGGKISQHAIKNLTEVGGGGIAGGLQGMALRLFKTFNYARLALSCTLAKGVCTMGGITPDPDPGDQGYTIVEGRGLPRITVIGHQRTVDWATLVGRLKAVTEGNAPVIR